MLNLQHLGNELHVYCRLRDWGVPKRVAVYVAKVVTFNNKLGYILGTTD